VTLRQVLLLDGCNMNDASVQVLASSCLLLREVSIKDSLSCSDKAAELLLQVLLPCALLILPVFLRLPVFPRAPLPRFCVSTTLSCGSSL
jgi:hypothetical protein